jgi:hypothetical protein
MRDGERVWILWASFLLGLSGHRTQAKPAFPVGSVPVACDARFRQPSQLGVSSVNLAARPLTILGQI